MNTTQLAELIKEKDIKGIKQFASQYSAAEQASLLKAISNIFYDTDDCFSGGIVDDLACISYLTTRRNNIKLEQDILLQLGEPVSAKFVKERTEYVKEGIERLNARIKRETQRLTNEN